MRMRGNDGDHRVLRILLLLLLALVLVLLVQLLFHLDFVFLLSASLSLTFAFTLLLEASVEEHDTDTHTHTHTDCFFSLFLSAGSSSLPFTSPTHVLLSTVLHTGDSRRLVSSRGVLLLLVLLVVVVIVVVRVTAVEADAHPKISVSKGERECVYYIGVSLEKVYRGREVDAEAAHSTGTVEALEVGEASH